MDRRVLGAVYRRDVAELMDLAHAVDINEVDEDGRTALMHAVLADNADVNVIETLINLGADINVHDDEQRWTALHFAARDHRSELVQILLDRGAEVNSLDIFGNTPLSRSLDAAPVDYEVIRVLLRHGAAPSLKNKYGNSPLDTAKLIGNKQLITLFDDEE